MIFDAHIQIAKDPEINRQVEELVTTSNVNCEYAYKTVSEMFAQMFEGMDSERAMLVYDFIVKYKTSLHVDDSVIQKLRDIIVKKYNNVEIYNVNPTIDDLFNNNVFKQKSFKYYIICFLY